MEEKERYSWFNHSTEEIYDNKENIVFVGAITALNQQNRRIWELVEENKQLKKQLEIFKISNDALQQDNLDLSYDKLDTAHEYAKEMAENWEKDYQEEIQQLKQSLEYTNRQLDYFTNKFRSREFKRTGDWMKDIELYMKQLAISELEALAKFSEENAYYYEEEQFAKQINKYISEKIKSLKG